jgi:hypothetical protein
MTDEMEIPACLIVTPAEAARRRQWWIDNPPEPIPAFRASAGSVEDATTRAFLEQQQAADKAKSYARIAKLQAKKAAQAIDHDKVRWCTKTAKWVPR